MIIRVSEIWDSESVAITEAGVEECEVVTEVLVSVQDTLQTANLAEASLPPGSSGWLRLWGLELCRLWPQR